MRKYAFMLASVVFAFLAGLWLHGLTVSAGAGAGAGPRGGGGQAFENGDTNGDGKRDLSDAVFLLSWLFAGGPEPVPVGRTECEDRIAELEGKLEACLTGPKGSVAFSWTVNGQPASTACPTGAAVRVRASASPSSDALVGVFTCDAGAGQVDDLPEGDYVFTFLLDDPTGPGSAAVVSGVPVTIVADALATLPPIDFSLEAGPALGEAVVSWTVNGGQSCPPGGAGEVSVSFSSGDGRDPLVATSSCSAYSARIRMLGAGVHSVELTLTDPAHPGQTATARLENVTILAGVSTDVGPIDIPCPFCPGG